MSVPIATLGERALRRLGVAVVPIADRPALQTKVVPVDIIATNALVELGVIASDETPIASDQALALGAVTRVQASLASQALVWWSDSGGVPMALAEEYIRLTAMYIASSFGKQVDPQLLPVWEARVRRMALILSAQDYANDAVMAVHNDLSARGLVRWSVWDLPGAAEEPYVMLAANRLAPLFDKPANPADDVAANIALARMIALPTSGETVAVNYF
jgi:hypothetical protein